MTAGEVGWEQDAAGDLPIAIEMMEEVVDAIDSLAQLGLIVLAVETEH